MGKVGWRRLAWIVAGLLLFALVPGCGKEKDEIYPLTVDGTEIMLDQTTMQEIFDAGFTVSVRDDSSGSVQWYEIEADMMLDAESVYKGIYIGKNDERYALISVVTEDACQVRDSVVYALKSTEEGIGKIAISSVLLTDLTEEKAKKIESNLKADGLCTSYVTDSIILRIARENGTTGAVTELEVEVRYDIEYLD